MNDHMQVVEGWGDGDNTRARFGFTCSVCGFNFSSLSESAIIRFRAEHTHRHRDGVI